MTGYQSKKKAASAKTIDQVNWADHEPDGLVHTAQDKLELVDYEKLAALGWQAIECPFCGSSGAQAFPKPVAQPAQEPELLRDAVFAVLEGFTLPHDVRKILEAAYYAAPLQPAQEPVAYLVYDKRAFGEHLAFEDELGDMDECVVEPLYTTPPQRTWVGLTDEEGQRIVNSCQTGTSREIFRAIEQALKEKNNGA